MKWVAVIELKTRELSVPFVAASADEASRRGREIADELFALLGAPLPLPDFDVYVRPA